MRDWARSSSWERTSSRAVSKLVLELITIRLTTCARSRSRHPWSTSTRSGATQSTLASKSHLNQKSLLVLKPQKAPKMNRMVAWLKTMRKRASRTLDPPRPSSAERSANDTPNDARRSAEWAPSKRSLTNFRSMGRQNYWRTHWLAASKGASSQKVRDSCWMLRLFRAGLALERTQRFSKTNSTTNAKSLQQALCRSAGVLPPQFSSRRMEWATISTLTLMMVRGAVSGIAANRLLLATTGAWVTS